MPSLRLYGLTWRQYAFLVSASTSALTGFSYGSNRDDAKAHPGTEARHSVRSSWIKYPAGVQGARSPLPSPKKPRLWRVRRFWATRLWVRASVATALIGGALRSLLPTTTRPLPPAQRLIDSTRRALSIAIDEASGQLPPPRSAEIIPFKKRPIGARRPERERPAHVVLPDAKVRRPALVSLRLVYPAPACCTTQADRVKSLGRTRPWIPFRPAPQ
jgi:hypothetical protein